MQWHRGRGSWHVLRSWPHTSMWWIISFWGWLEMKLTHQAYIPTHSFLISLLLMGATQFPAGIPRELTTRMQVADKGWGKSNSISAQAVHFLKSPKKLRSSWQHWSICLAPNSHASCGCDSMHLLLYGVDRRQLRREHLGTSELFLSF